MRADRYIVQGQNQYVSRPVDVVRLINAAKVNSKKEKYKVIILSLSALILLIFSCLAITL